MISRRLSNLLARILRRTVLPLVPDSQKLPFRYWLHLTEDVCENELRHLHQIACSGEIAVDVGANEGLFSYNLSRRFAKVHAFEINADLTHELRAYNRGNIEMHTVGLSSKEDSAVLYIPVVNDRALTGWASLAPGNCPDAKDHIEKQVRICPLDQFDLNPVSFIKVDVEGHEVEVLEGAVRTLARCRPTVLVEVKSQNLSKVVSFFIQLNYSKKNLQDLTGIKGSEENYIFVPNEKN